MNLFLIHIQTKDSDIHFDIPMQSLLRILLKILSVAFVALKVNFWLEACNIYTLILNMYTILK